MRQRILTLQGDPFGACQVRRGDDARTLHHFREFFLRAFDGQNVALRFEGGDGEDLARHFEDERLPLQTFGGVREREAVGTEPVDHKLVRVSQADRMERIYIPIWEYNSRMAPTGWQGVDLQLSGTATEDDPKKGDDDEESL